MFLFLFRAGTWLAAPFHAKAALWVRGRKKIFSRLREAIPAGEKIIWVHCASLGEFEQGRPIMERLRIDYPAHKILLTFFSPSGYEVQKNYAGADWIFYLPADGPNNARRFLDIVNPALVIFVKYEFWYYYCKKIKYRNIPLLLVSSLFRRDMSFFKWYGGLQRKILARFDHLFVQNESSLKLLQEIGLGEISSVGGDTRFDRVIAIAEQGTPVPVLESFGKNQKMIVAGSTWSGDEAAIAYAMERLSHENLIWVIAPHDTGKEHITELKTRFPDAAFYTELGEGKSIPPGTSLLVVDTVGLLSRMYRYAFICYVGGGLRVMGVHNVLEAAVYGKPVVTGPFYQKYAEAVGLINEKGGLFFQEESAEQKGLTEILQALLSDPAKYNMHSEAARQFVYRHQGATARIMEFIQEKRLLIN
ncbi:MAG: 3-deoxy-D-manno-octulosonic acid transferase [Chitinophagaceae bacterium]|nr:3-deoxy-D-manno-octulosonic acid transferase [Chitinophagaceae bacterium]